MSIEELLQTLVIAPAQGTTVFFSSHQLSEVERIADDILMIDRGRSVLDMSLDQIRENYRRVTLGFNTEVPAFDTSVTGAKRSAPRAARSLYLPAATLTV